MSSELEIIDAFIDGQRVDGDAIKRALADPEGRAYMVDAWLLREAIQEGERGSFATTLPASRSAKPAQRWLVAAAITVSLLGGYVTGRFTERQAPPIVALPVTTAAQPSPAFPVPAATRVIQLEFHAAKTTGGD